MILSAFGKDRSGIGRGRCLCTRQNLLRMKITSFLLLIGCLHVSARTGAQYITLSVKDAQLQTVLTELEKQSGYDFFFNDAILKAAVPVTLSVKETPIEQVLSICFKDQPLYFKIIANTVVISDNPATAQDVIDIKNSGPPGEIKGRITTAEGITLSGANIIIQRTKKGTQTNAKGEFELTGVYPADVLKISYIGYKTLTIKVGDGKEFPIIMEATKNELDQVVVQAYGTTTQRLATGNIATVTAAQIERQPVMNVLEALQGQVPGVVVQQTNGYASAPIKVEIRGRTSLNPKLPSDPLYIIDGVPLTVLNADPASNYASGSSGFIQNGFNGPAQGQSPLFSINPNDIESLTVLKDADATAIYGSRGANGVILITTKKGKPGKTKLELNVYEGISKITGKYDLLDLHQYLSVRREAFKNDGVVPDPGNAYDLLIWDTTRSTDWQQNILGNVGKLIEAQAALSGGDKQTTFRIGADYHHQTSILSYSGADQRASIDVNISRKSINQRFVLSFVSTFSYTQSDLIEFSTPPLLSPNTPPIFDSNGKLNYAGWRPVDGNFSFASILQPYTAKTSFLNSQLTLQYEIVKGLNLSGSFGYSFNHGTQMQIYPIASLNPFQANFGSSTFGNNNGMRAIVEPQLEYKTLIGKGSLTVMVGGSVQTVSQDGNSIRGFGYINDALLRSVSNAPQRTADNYEIQYKYAAFFGRINYNWQDKYILNLSARRDGSSRFGPGKQYGNFGAVGVAWIFTGENWFKDHIGFLSFGKIRGSYGSTGSDNIGDYQYLTQWSAVSTPPYQINTPAYTPNILANPDFRWELNKKLELALNLGFLNDRINVEASFYRNRCDNQLVSFPLPGITGFNYVIANSPANVQNTGWEVIFRAKVIKNKNIDLDINVNAGRNYNKLLAYPNLEKSPYYGSYIIGRPLNLQTVLHYTGIDPLTGQYSFQDINKDGSIYADYPAKGGDYYYREKNILLDGGIGIDLRYKHLQVNIFFTYRKDPFAGSAIYANIPGFALNQSTQVLNHWRKPGDVAQFAGYTTTFRQSDALFYQNSDGIYSNGSYIRLRNLAISYDMPMDWAKKVLQSCKLYVRGENLFILTRYNGIDPDVQGLGAMPPAKVFTGGIQFNF